MAYIYKITNDINNKIYIGKTEYVNPEDRWKQHLKEYNKKRCEKRPLYSAINKYGEEHFHFEVIEETDNPEEREQYWIEKLRTYVGFNDCNGYNATLGGDGKSYLNLDENEVIKYHVEEACYRLRETSKYFNVDRKTILKILNKNNTVYVDRVDAKRMQTYEELGGVLQIDIKTKIIINIFENTCQANIYMNKPIKSRCIMNACNNNTSHISLGYLWYYGKDLEKAIKDGNIIDIDKLGKEYYMQIEI